MHPIANAKFGIWHSKRIQSIHAPFSAKSWEDQVQFHGQGKVPSHHDTGKQIYGACGAGR
jgi:hypothetical protein